jgi:hypothetical protein
MHAGPREQALDLEAGLRAALGHRLLLAAAVLGLPVAAQLTPTLARDAIH